MGYLKVYKKWLPYAGMADPRGFISQQFGGEHSGVDSVGNVYNNPVCAVMDGRVIRVDKTGALGNIVEYESGRVKIAHYHLAKVLVKEGDTVKSGDTVLGIEGSTGSLATGKHLHTSLWVDGVLSDPEAYLSGAKALPAEDRAAALEKQVQTLQAALAEAERKLDAVRKAVGV